MMTKKERLEEIIRYYSDGKPTAFAKFLGVAPSTVSTWLSRDTFDYDLLFAKCEEINAEWLLSGEGEMLSNNNVSNQIIKTNAGIPLIPIDAMAGALTYEQSILEYDCERYVVPAFKGADFLIPVKGASMYPNYSSGDIVACQRVSMSDLFFQWNKVYVLDTNQGAIIKRIKPGKDKEHILIVSDNSDFDPFELPVSAINAGSLVIGVIRLE